MKFFRILIILFFLGCGYAVLGGIGPECRQVTDGNFYRTARSSGFSRALMHCLWELEAEEECEENEEEESEENCALATNYLNDLQFYRFECLNNSLLRTKNRFKLKPDGCNLSCLATVILTL